MSLHVARRCIDMLGPCRVLHADAENGALLTELLLAGCDAWVTGDMPLQHPRWVASTATQQVDTASYPAHFDAFVLELPFHSNVTHELARYVARFGAPDVLVLLANGHSRPACDNALFENGWRRHPAGLRSHEYPGLTDEQLGEITFYQRIPDDAARRWPIAALRAERGLHMDMLRESGGRADALVARYALAAEHVRPGDTVLDCACGLGYGTAILAALSPGANFIGADADATTVAYAQANYGREAVSYRTADAAMLDGVPDASVDMVVAMDTFAHVEDWQVALRAFHRVLKPDGRLIASVPDRADPNPHHVQIFDWAKLEDGLSENFIIESRYVHLAPGGFKFPRAERALRQVDFDTNENSEWLLVVASANPFNANDNNISDYVHPAFSHALAASGAAVIDFAKGYDNPYLYRVMVQMGERLRDDDKLARLAYWVATNARSGSADQGAAICVLGYRALKDRDIETATEVMDLLRVYDDATAGERENPHVIRWRLSLAFVAGKISELCGNHDEALHWFEAAAHGNWRDFSPLLATKAIAGAFCAGRLHLVRGDADAARGCFAHGLTESIAAIQSDPRTSIGDPNQPIPFGLTEIAEVADMGSQCANAIAHLPLWRRNPGLFWRHVDVKRFGLVTWLLDLERDNKELRERLGVA